MKTQKYSIIPIGALCIGAFVWANITSDGDMSKWLMNFPFQILLLALVLLQTIELNRQKAVSFLTKLLGPVSLITMGWFFYRQHVVNSPDGFFSLPGIIGIAVLLGISVFSIVALVKPLCSADGDPE